MRDSRQPRANRSTSDETDDACFRTEPFLRGEDSIADISGWNKHSRAFRSTGADGVDEGHFACTVLVGRANGGCRVHT